jgi:hypothetical protein
MIFILTEAQTSINPRVSYVLLFSTSVSTHTLKSSKKPRQSTEGKPPWEELEHLRGKEAMRHRHGMMGIRGMG